MPECKHDVIKCFNFGCFCTLCGAKLTVDQITTLKEQSAHCEKPTDAVPGGRG